MVVILSRGDELRSPMAKYTYGDCYYHIPCATIAVMNHTEHIIFFFIRYSQIQDVNTLRPRQNGRHFPDDILKCIFLNENVLISIKISLKFVPKGQINNIPALV